MFSDKKQFFENMISERIRQLRGVIPQDAIFPEVYPRESIKDENDLATEIVQNEIELTLVHSNRTSILALQRALGRIRSGRFGYCEECEEPIPENRLMARPESHLCIKCQSSMEKRKGYGKGH